MSEEILYICERCGEKFSLEDGKRLKTEEGLFTLCPNCGYTEFEDGVRCPICREIYYPFEMEGEVCKGCFADAVSAWKSCISSLMPWERAALESKYGNIDITEE